MQTLYTNLQKFSFVTAIKAISADDSKAAIFIALEKKYGELTVNKLAQITDSTSQALIYFTLVLREQLSREDSMKLLRMWCITPCTLATAEQDGCVKIRLPLTRQEK